MDGTLSTETTATGRGTNERLREVTVTFPADELKALDEGAKEESISRSYALRQGARLWLKQRKAGR